jgi:hypothetical protein
MRVDLCLQSLLTAGEGRGEPRIPRVQGEKGRYDSITYPQSGSNLREITSISQRSET